MSAGNRHKMDTPEFYLAHNPGMTEFEAHREAAQFRAEAAEDDRLLNLRYLRCCDLALLAVREPAAMKALELLTAIVGIEAIRTGMNDGGHAWDMLARISVLPSVAGCASAVRVEFTQGRTVQ